MIKEVTDKMLIKLRFEQKISPRKISKILEEEYGISMSPTGIIKRCEKISKTTNTELQIAGKAHISDELMNKLIEAGFTFSEIYEITNVNLSKSTLWRDYNKVKEEREEKKIHKKDEESLEELDSKINKALARKKKSEELLDEINKISYEKGKGGEEK